jgi:murein DD-endopeptidase MepM/ murein hydrolase activator NlpD
MSKNNRFAGRDKPSFLRTHAGWFILAILIDVILVAWYFHHFRKSSSAEPRVPVPARATSPEAPVMPPLVINPIRVGYPTERQDLRADNPEAFMPTASGKPESALYGSVRTAKSGSGLISQFHEGIDIAPLARDAAHRPVDSIYAAAEGKVAYINRAPGNSSYGQFVVLLHTDPLGEVYTLYAHLAMTAPGLKEGDPVRRRSLLGLMGNTPNVNIPLARAHLHFEVGLLNNSRFDRWFRAQRLTPDHGLYNGQNLTGVNPLDVFGSCDSDGNFEFRDYLQHLSPAFELLLKTSKQLDYFTRYPTLWKGPPYDGRGMHLSVSEGGALLQGRNLEPDEKTRLDRKRAVVARVDEAVLGRNGRHLIVHRGSSWDIGSNGRQWLDILCF